MLFICFSLDIQILFRASLTNHQSHKHPDVTITISIHQFSHLSTLWFPESHLAHLLVLHNHHTSLRLSSSAPLYKSQYHTSSLCLVLLMLGTVVDVSTYLALDLGCLPASPSVLFCLLLLWMITNNMLCRIADTWIFTPVFFFFFFKILQCQF